MYFPCDTGSAVQQGKTITHASTNKRPRSAALTIFITMAACGKRFYGYATRVQANKLPRERELKLERGMWRGVTLLKQVRMLNTKPTLSYDENGKFLERETLQMFGLGLIVCVNYRSTS
jgi:hypothetical protein